MAEMLPKFNPNTHIVTVKHLPEWAASTDVVVRRGKRYWLVSTHEPERRWRAWVRWVRRVVGQHGF